MLLKLFGKSSKQEEKQKDPGPAAKAVSPAETEAEKAARQAAREAEKAAKLEAAKAEYRAKRDITLGRLFEIGGLPFPEDNPKAVELRDRVISDFSTDPRRLNEGSVFFYWGKSPISVGGEGAALRMAQEKNCLFILSHVPFDAANCHVVPDIAPDDHRLLVDAYINVSHYIRSIHKAKVITVTGSVGKTSTKEMIESVLRAHYRKPLISKGNNNSMFSVTRNIQELKRGTNVYLQEVGAFAPRTIEYSARQLEADLCVYTNIGHSHIEAYGSQEALNEDKLSLSTYGSPKGTAFINYDDPILMAHTFGPDQKVVTYSLENPDARYYARDILLTGTGYSFTIVDTSEDTPQEHRAQIHVLGKHNVLNAVAAYAIGRALKLDTDEILTGLADYRPSGMRQNLMTAKGGYQIFADCYNSSLLAVENTLATMDQIQLEAGGRKIAVLGDVLALGDLTEDTHRRIGQVVAAHQIDRLYGYGIAIRYAVEEAASAGIPAFYFEDRGAMEKALRSEVTKRDLILFKASHGVNMGSTIDRLFGTDVNESSSIAHKQFRLETRGDFEFYIFETHASLKTYLGSDPIVNVPATVTATVTDELHEVEVERVLNVEKIGKTAFRGNTAVQEVILPETVVRIRDGAFQGSSLTRFEGPDSLISIGDEAFADCPNLTTLTLSDNTTDLGRDLLAGSPQATLQYK